MIDASLVWFADRGCREVIVVTQGRNCRGQRLYQRAGFVSNVRSDLTTYGGWPVAGDAWEVPGGPHLVGHPDVEIFHWIEIGGLGDGDSATYYADSATTVWSGVPAYSWIDTQTLVTILGGRGYAW